MNNKYLGVYFSIETKTPIAYNAGGKRHWYVWEWDAGTVLLIGTNEKMPKTFCFLSLFFFAFLFLSRHNKYMLVFFKFLFFFFF